jgi:hypothetical protein
MKRNNTIHKFAKGESASCEKTETIFVDPPISNPPMNEQPIVPPPHVWSKIERILEEQEKTKAATESLKRPHVPAALPAEKLSMMFTSFGVTFLA